MTTASDNITKRVLRSETRARNGIIYPQPDCSSSSSVSAVTSSSSASGQARLQDSGADSFHVAAAASAAAGLHSTMAQPLPNPAAPPTSARARGPDSGKAREGGEENTGKRAKVVVKKEDPIVIKGERNRNVKHEGSIDGHAYTDEDYSMTSESEDDEVGSTEPKRGVQLKTLSISSFQDGLNGKAEKAIALTHFIFLRSSTSLQEFLEMIRDDASHNLVGELETWRIALTSTLKGDPFKDDPVELLLNSPTCASTFKKWLKDSVWGNRTQGGAKGSSGSGNSVAKVYGVGKPQSVTASGKESRTPLQHVDPEIAAAAERIYSANHCNDTHCSVKSSDYPACWPVPGKDEHLNLRPSNILTWATALAAKDPTIGVRYPPPYPPYIYDSLLPKLKGKNQSGSKRRRSENTDSLAQPEEKKQKTSKSNNTRNGKARASEADVKQQKLEAGGSREDASDSIEGHHGPSSPVTPPKPSTSSASTSTVIEIPDSSPPPEVVSPTRQTARRSKIVRGPFLSLDEFAALYGLPESIRSKLQAYYISDSYVVGELEQTDYDAIGLTKGEPRVLESVIRRWQNKERIPRSAFDASAADLGALHGHGDQLPQNAVTKSKGPDSADPTDNDASIGERVRRAWSSRTLGSGSGASGSGAGANDTT
ncbi:hypothetical protein V8E36_008530 [Tilletia maclaganii]